MTTTITAPRVSTGAGNRRVVVAARLSLAASAAFVLLLAAVHVLKPDLDPSWRMVSEYEIGRHGWLMQSAFVALAVATVSVAMAARPHVAGRTGRVGLALLLIAAAGTALAGFAVSDPITAAPDELTQHGNLHGVGALLGIPTFPVAAALVSRGLRNARTGASALRGVRLATLGTWAGLSQFLMAMLLFVPGNGGTFGPETPIGLPNRVLILTYVAWLVTVAVPLRKRPSPCLG